MHRTRLAKWTGLALAGLALVVGTRFLLRPAMRPTDRANCDGVDQYGDPLPDGAVARLGTVRYRSTSNGNLIFLPDGNLLSGGFDGEIVEWELATGRRLRTLPGHRGFIDAPVTSYDLRDWQRAVVEGDRPGWEDELDGLALSADGKTLVSYGRAVRVWDLRAWVQRREILRSPSYAVVTPDASVLVSIDKAGFRRENLATGAELPAVPTAGGDYSLAVATSGRLFANEDADGVIRIWSLPDCKLVQQLAGAPKKSSPLAFSADSQTLWSGHDLGVSPDAGEIRQWDIATGACVRTWPAGGRVVSLAVSRDGRFVASGHFGTGAAVWDAATATCVRRFDATLLDWPFELVFTPDGSALAAKVGRAVRIFDIATGAERHPLAAHDWPVHQIALSPDGERAATSGGGNVRIWDVRSGRPQLAIPTQNLGTLAWTSDGSTIVCGGLDSILRFDAATGESRGAMDLAAAAGHKHAFCDALSADGRLACVDAPRRIVSTIDGSARCEIAVSQRLDDGQTSPFEFSADGSRVFWCSAVGLHLVDTTTGAEVCLEPIGGRSQSPALALSPDGRLLASACNDAFLVHAIPSGAGVLERHCDGLTSNRHGFWGSGQTALAFSPDGKLLATGGCDAAVRLWSIPDGKCLASLRGHGGAITSLAFSPQGELLVSGSEDTSALVWDVAAALRHGP